MEPLDIKVVFDANARGRRRAPAAPAPAKRSHAPRATTSAMRPRGSASRGFTMTLSLVTLLLAGGFYYFTWWQADPELTLRLLTKTPLPGVDLDMLAAGMFGGPLPDADGPAPAEEEPPPAIAPETATYVIPASVYTWLSLATISAFFLAVCAGGGLRASSGGSLMLPGVLAVLVVLGVCGWYINNHGVSIPKEPRVIRTGMGLVPLLGLGLGMLLIRNARRWGRVAAISLILSAVVTAVGLQLGNMTAAFDAEQVTPLVIAGAFIGHSLWGWVLLLGSRRFPA